MRQLGVRLPGAPAVETGVETSSEILPHERQAVEAREPVEVHRVERTPVEPKIQEPAGQLRITEVAGTFPTPKAESVGPLPEPDSHERYEGEERELVEVYRIEPKPIEVAPAELLRETAAADVGRGPVADLSNVGPHAVEAREATEMRGMERNSTEAEASRPPQEREVKGGAATRRGPLPDGHRPARKGTGTGAASVGRWEEFHEPRKAQPERGSRSQLELVPLRQGAPSRLLTADLETEHRSSFLTLVVPCIAALLVIGALLWSGLLRYRARQQDAAMIALQQQNQKLTAMLAQMGEELKSPITPTSGADAAGTAQQTAPPVAKPVQSEHVALPSEEKSKAARQSENRQGVSVPPLVQQRGRVSARQKDSLYEHPPEIVPPYPTNFKTENTAPNATNSQPVPPAGTDQEPSRPGASQQAVTAPASERPVTSTGTAPHGSAPQTSAASVAPAPVAANNRSAPASTSYDAASNDAGIGSHANMLAQNIEAVQGLQRHSPVQLKEFHARAGTPTQATPNVRLSVEHPDQGSGSYALVIAESGSTRQLRGGVNRPLVFTDTATHREYALVVLSIAGQQVYGYVRSAQ